MKILNKSDNVIIEVTDKNRIEKLLGYPDKFEPIEEKLTDEEPALEPINEEIEEKLTDEEKTSKKGKRL